MVNMDIKKLDKSELLNLKADIETQLEYINKVDRLKNKKNLSELTKDDEIYCINFNDSKIYKHDFVKITTSECKHSDDWVKFSASSPMGCSASFHKDYLNKHYFLSLFSGNSMYFFTLKPENWKEDLKSASDFQIELRKQSFDKEIKIFGDQITDILSIDDKIWV